MFYQAEKQVEVGGCKLAQVAQEDLGMVVPFVVEIPDLCPWYLFTRLTWPEKIKIE